MLPDACGMNAGHCIASKLMLKWMSKTEAVQALKRSTAGRPVVGVGLEVGFENQDTRDSRIVVRARAANASRRRLCPCVHGCAASAAELDLPATHLHPCHTYVV